MENNKETGMVDFQLLVNLAGELDCDGDSLKMAFDILVTHMVPMTEAVINLGYVMKAIPEDYPDIEGR